MYALDLSEVRVTEASVRRFREEVVKGLPKRGRCWIILRANVSVMATAVFQDEVCVEHLSERDSSYGLIVRLTLVDELVAGESADSGHVPPHESEDSPVCNALTMLVLEDERG